LWNPLDYLRLLYWVFFFPQALRWYVDTFGDGYIPPEQMTRQKGWELLRQNPIQRQLLLQGLALTVVTPLALRTILQQIGVPLDWSGVSWGMVLGMAVGVAAGVELGVAFGVELGVAVGLVSGVTAGVAVGLVSGVTAGVAVGVAFGVAAGVTFGIVVGVVSGVTAGVAVGVVVGLVAGVLLSVVFSIVLNLSGGVVLSLSGGVTAGVVVSLSILRPENWLLGLPLVLRSSWNGSWLLTHVTPLPLFSLSSRLTNWLRPDWETGLHNVNQLLAYTLQFYPVVKAVNQVLAETPPDQVIFRVIQLAEAPFDWKLVYFASASLNKALKSKAVEGFWFLPIGWQQRFQARFVTDTRLDTPARAAAAGFWHLHEKDPAKATEAFAVVRPLLYGKEMFALAQTLAAFHEAKESATIAALQISASPPEPLLRPTTWETIISLRRIVEDVQTVERSVSRYSRSSALNRALGQLKNILDNANTLPQAEQGLIVDIAQTWQNALLNVAGEVGEIAITEPVSNPYVVGDPVEGNLFVGREDVIRELKELWVRSRQLQSVVLYGHRRMGKTSILRNVANRLELGVWVAYVNLLEVGDASLGVAEVLMAISDAISDTVQIPPPANDDLLNLPLPTFRRYFKQVEAELGEKGLIIALDEFEKIEELIEAQKIPIDFMGVLRGLVQKSSKVAFTFAGLHTLEEMTADYFQPFFASVAPPIKVGFMKLEATHQILARPDEEFPLDYTPEALDQIYALTAGQPYLVQLVGFQLVRRYNDYVFEQGRPRDRDFTVEDVEAVINDPEFFKRGRYYFDGVWGQAARGASGQQAILKVLAPHPQGLNIDALAQATGMEEKTLQEALKTLKRHDVVEEREGCWQIIVELFRRWVLQS
jgi:AAA+ ATPase superfamily predicted ATPase